MSRWRRVADLRWVRGLSTSSLRQFVRDSARRMALRALRIVTSPYATPRKAISESDKCEASGTGRRSVVDRRDRRGVC